MPADALWGCRIFWHAVSLVPGSVKSWHRFHLRPGLPHVERGVGDFVGKLGRKLGKGLVLGLKLVAVHLLRRGSGENLLLDRNDAFLKEGRTGAVITQRAEGREVEVEFAGESGVVGASSGDVAAVVGNCYNECRIGFCGGADKGHAPVVEKGFPYLSGENGDGLGNMGFVVNRWYVERMKTELPLGPELIVCTTTD